jgi:hypothetical protein
MDAAAEGSRVRERAMSRASESGRVARKVRTIPRELTTACRSDRGY